MKSCSISKRLNITCDSRHSDTERPKMESVPKSLSPYPNNVISVFESRHNGCFRGDLRSVVRIRQLGGDVEPQLKVSFGMLVHCCCGFGLGFNI